MVPEEEKNNTQHEETATEQEQNTVNQQTEESQIEPEESQEGKLKQEIGELKDKYLRLYSEFDNFRRRTSKERVDLAKLANEEVLISLLPVIDDFERAQKSMGEANDISALKEGVSLIHHKLYKTLENKGLQSMESSIGKEFNSELMEAITQSPAPSNDLKGKVIDEIEKGYYLHGKVIRFAKVIIGS